jgi:hypothetical protein
MNERPEPGEHALTLHDVPDHLLAEYGFRRGVRVAVSYRCIDKEAVLIRTSDVYAKRPDRKLNEDAIRDLLSGFRGEVALPPILVYRKRGAAAALLINGMHRCRVSGAFGYPMIPCLLLTRDEADAYGLS